MKARTLIADDEPLARQRLRDLVAEIGGLEIIGEAGDGAAALAAIDDHKPELVLLDINMPVLSGLEVMKRAAHRPAVIFTTAHDQFAVAAFELAAVDYLLKPFGAERLRTAVERALDGRDRAGPSRVAQLLGSEPIERLFVKDRGRIVPLAAAKITRFEARDDYVAVHVGARSYLMHVTLGELERRLDPGRFLRIHRTHVVNLDHVQAMEPYDTTRLMVQMRDGTKIMASRSRSKELRELAR